MKCPKCKSENVSVDLVQVEGKTKKHSNGLGGHINNTARGLTAVRKIKKFLKNLKKGV